MNSKELLEKAIALKPEERLMLVEGLLETLDKPDREIAEIWTKEAEKRLKAYREGRLEGIPMEDVFREKKEGYFLKICKARVGRCC